MSQSTPPKIPKGLQRKQSMIIAARAVFTEHGFEGTTLEMIIEQSGGSRSSLYHHFGDKEGLFVAVVKDMIESIFNDPSELASSEAVEDILMHYGERFLTSILHPQTLSLFRLIVAETERFPKLGALFYQLGPESTYCTVADALRKNPQLAQYSEEFLYRFACHFIEMIKGELFMKALCIKDFIATEQTIKESLKLSVSLMICLLTHHDLNDLIPQ